MLKGDCGEASLREKIISLATPGEANPLCLLWFDYPAMTRVPTLATWISETSEMGQSGFSLANSG